MDIAQLALPAEWQVKAIQDAYNFTKKPKGLRLEDYSEVPFIPMELVPLSHIFAEDWNLKSTTELGSGTYFENGDLLVAKITPSFENGKQAIAKIDRAFGYATTEVIPLQEIEGTSDKFYLHFILLNPEIRKELAAKMDGSTGRQRLRKEILASKKIPLPPLDEQRRIAHVLSTVQAAIEQQARLIALTSELKSALLRKLFTEGVVKTSQVLKTCEVCGARHRADLKHTEIGLVPESWDVVELNDVVKQKIVDGVHQTPTYIETGIPFITAKDIVDNTVDFSECRFISEDEHHSLTRKIKPKRGDVLLTKVGTVGNTALIDFDQEFSIFVQLALISPNQDKVNSEFLYWALQSEAVQIEIMSNAPQSTMKFIGTQKIAKVKIPLPDLSEQSEIAEILDAVRRKIIATKRKKALLEELFRTLLHHLMTAQIRVKEDVADLTGLKDL
jgi:type I restriction enzyme, S subunit